MLSIAQSRKGIDTPEGLQMAKNRFQLDKKKADKMLMENWLNLKRTLETQCVLATSITICLAVPDKFSDQIHHKKIDHIRNWMVHVFFRLEAQKVGTTRGHF